jgi:hypothetical protein
MYKLALFLVALSNTLPQPIPPAVQARPQPSSTEVRRCQPSVWDVLAAAGWAYVVRTSPPSPSARPCPDKLQEMPSKRPTAQLDTAPPSRLAHLPAAEALRQARRLFIRPRSSRFNPEKLERELLKQKEFGALGLELTRNATHAELILEITRKRFTTRFTCSILEPASQRVVAAATASSLGGEIEPHLAAAILQQFKAAHATPARED